MINGNQIVTEPLFNTQDGRRLESDTTPHLKLMTHWSSAENSEESVRPSLTEALRLQKQKLIQQNNLNKTVQKTNEYYNKSGQLNQDGSKTTASKTNSGMIPPIFQNGMMIINQ